MKNIRLEWKEFSVSLGVLEEHLKTNFPSYKGNSADYALTLYFDDSLTEQEEADILTHWESLDGSDYKSSANLAAEQAELDQAILEAKLGLVSKTWAQMSATDRKLVLGLPVTREDMGLE